MNCLIVLNGEKIDSINLNKIVDEADFVICADGGAKWAYEEDIKVDAIIGDFDSIDNAIIELYKNTDTKIIKAPCEKDETDGVLAVDYALLMGADDITILGASGGRLDHQYGNLMLLKRLLNVKCKSKILLKDGYAFMSNDDIKMHCNVGDTISIVPFEGELVINSSKGLKFKIDKGTYFRYGYPVGISNVAIDDLVEIEIVGGTALIFCYSI